MKTLKSILLIGAALLSTQELLAENARMQVQTKAANAEQQMAPTTAAKTLPKGVVSEGQAPVFSGGPGSVAGPELSHENTVRPTQPMVQVIPTLSDPNLTVTSIGWNDEICVAICPTVMQDLKLAKATCGVEVRISNAGGAVTGNSFRIKLDWTNHNGQSESRVKIMSSMGANEARTILFTAQDIWYYKTNRPFTITLDDFNVITETNEGDNIKSFSPQ